MLLKQMAEMKNLIEAQGKQISELAAKWDTETKKRQEVEDKYRATSNWVEKVTKLNWDPLAAPTTPLPLSINTLQLPERLQAYDKIKHTKLPEEIKKKVQKENQRPTTRATASRRNLKPALKKPEKPSAPTTTTPSANQITPSKSEAPKEPLTLRIALKSLPLRDQMIINEQRRRSDLEKAATTIKKTTTETVKKETPKKAAPAKPKEAIKILSNVVVQPAQQKLVQEIFGDISSSSDSEDSDSSASSS